jgi:hypothetical protein
MAEYFQRRMCTFTKRPIDSKDRSSVQIPLVKLGANGVSTGEIEIIDVCGSIRQTGEIDNFLFEYAKAS